MLTSDGGACAMAQSRSGGDEHVHEDAGLGLIQEGGWQPLGFEARAPAYREEKA